MKTILLLIGCLTFVVGCGGCLTRKEVEAYVWLNNAPIPTTVCDREPTLWQYGFYRRLNTGDLEFISFCSPEARRWMSMHERDYNRILKAALPRRRE